MHRRRRPVGRDGAGPVDNDPVRSAPQSPGNRQDDSRFHVCVVCSGNICRSPIGEQVLRVALAEAGLADRVRVSSAGIGDWHIGQGANERTVRVLQRAGYPTEHLARQITSREMRTVDLAVAADRGHLRDLRRMTNDSDKVVLLRAFDQDADRDEVPDPYYGPDAGFDDVLEMTIAAAPGLIEEIRRRLDTDSARTAGE